MKVIAYIFTIVFLGCIAVPSIVIILDNEINCSRAYTVNEEENKSEINFQLKFTSQESSDFLMAHQEPFENEDAIYDSRQGYHNIYIDVSFPPPKHL